MREGFPRRCAVAARAATCLLACVSIASAENRSYDGSGNNLTNPTWGSSATQLLRKTPCAYDNGSWTMAGASRLSPRMISNMVVQQNGSIVNNRGLTDWTWQWGQFLDHDLDLTDPASPAEPANIPVPVGDPVFGFSSIPFNRSTWDGATGTDPSNPRQQMNSTTSYLDGSMIYGASSGAAGSLRELSGGRMLTSAGGLLPEDGGGMFIAGDPRANEQVGLTSVHTLFVREHNYWAGQIESSNPGWSDEQIYQAARKVVGAEIQSITFNEWLPALTGATMPAYGGYNASVDPSISNEFATALFRVGHTMLSPELQRLNDDGTPIAEGPIALQSAFFNPDAIRNEGGISPILKGLASQAMQEVDAHIVEDVRSFLFTIPTGGLDLASLNIQRGRDHGLPDYNTVRQAFGLAPVSDFSDITSDATLAGQLAAAFGSVNDIDVWVGALAEDHLPGSSLGELLTAGILDQFLRLRDGDRFWFENDPELAAMLGQIRGTSLADIIMRNTDITSLQGNVFFVPEPASGLFVLTIAALALRRRR